MNKFIVSLLLLLFLQPLSAQTFKIATAAPDGTFWMKELRSSAKTIQQRTNGRVKFRFYPGGVMGSDKSVLRKINIGQLHGGLITGGGLASVYPDANLYNLPFTFHNYAEVDYVRKDMDQRLMAGLKQNGYISFGFSEGGFAYMMANVPVRSVQDLHGLKVWIPEGDRVSQTSFEAANVSPLPLPLADVLTGLQTGLIDTVAGSPVGAIALQWHTQVHYLTDVPLMYLYGSMMVKRKHFEKLSKTDQIIVIEEMGKAFAKINEQNRRDDGRARQVLKKLGIEFVHPLKDETKQWVKMADSATQMLLKDGYIDKQNHQHMLNLLTTYRKTR
ncbi:MAG: TRAP transporter substrate-binding protein DctP [Gammaproteobacteria bacterium]|nr:TRAP transporter substrate-binding protein DctP [Gammaproteobacteria bacterium]